MKAIHNMQYLCAKYNFTVEEIQAIKGRFDIITDKGIMTQQQFRDSLGILGLEPYLSERIYNHIAENGVIVFEDFVKYLSMLLNGSSAEKALWSFKLLSNNKSILEIEDMERMIFEICYLWNSMTGSKSMPKKELVEEIFGVFDRDHDGLVSFEEFRVIYQDGVELIGWYEFLNNEDVRLNCIKEEWEMQNTSRRKRKRQTLINRPSLEMSQSDLITQQLRYLQQELMQCSELVRKEREAKSLVAQQVNDVVTKSHGPHFNEGQALQMQGDDDPEQEEFFLNKGDLQFNSERFQHQMMSKLRFILQLTEQIKKLNGQQKHPPQSKVESSVLKKVSKSQISSFNQSFCEDSPTQHKNLSIYFGHENWNLVVNMMIGIRKAIKSLHPLSDDIILTASHFDVKHQFEIIPKRTQRDFDYKKSCQFYEYTPMIFERIRKMYNVTNDDFLRSIGPEQLLGDLIFGNLSTLTEKVSSGKSGSFFYQSSDDRYLLKTISKHEFLFFRSIIKNYFKHLSEHFNTMIIKIFGLYKMKQFRSKTKALKLYFVVMQNIFNSEDIERIYDLKGSLYQRTSRIKGKEHNKTIPLKDLDWLDDKMSINLPSKINELFRMQLEKDLVFFETNRIIDYSLLIGISKFNNNKQQQTNKRKRFYEQEYGGIISQDRQYIYQIGIIDIFTEFNNKKLLEHKIKHTFISKDISCIPPDLYSQRFQKFILQSLS